MGAAPPERRGPGHPASGATGSDAEPDERQAIDGSSNERFPVDEFLADEDATYAYAARLVRILPPGALVLLEGPLGAGKTTLVAGLAAALGSTAHVTSPTYTLIHEYPIPGGVLIHIDAYRLNDPTALLDMGLDEYLERARLVVVEWGGPLAALRPEAWRVRLTRSMDPDASPDAGRGARLTAGGA